MLVKNTSKTFTINYTLGQPTSASFPATTGTPSTPGETIIYGNVTASRKFDVYGLVRGSTGISTSRHKFVGGLGHTSEDESGLVYMRARYYDPQTGRFASEDPAMDGSNWFIYAGNNPINFVDGNGKTIQPLLEFIGFVAFCLFGLTQGLEDLDALPPSVARVIKIASMLTAAMDFGNKAINYACNIGKDADKAGTYRQAYAAAAGITSVVCMAIAYYQIFLAIHIECSDPEVQGWENP